MTIEQWQNLLIWIPLLPLIGFVINGFGGSRLPRQLSGVIASLTMAGSFALSLVTLSVLLSDEMTTAMADFTFAGGHAQSPYLHQAYTWITSGDLSVAFGFYIDPLACVMCLVVTGIGTLIHIYSIGYMAHDAGKSRFFAYLNLFCFAMLCLVMADNMVLLFLGWEGVGLCSYLLIGFWFDDPAKAKAGQKAFIVNRIGDAFFIVGLAWLFWHTGTLSLVGTMSAEGAWTPGIREILSSGTGGLNTLVAGSGAAIGICLLLFVGACGKSAQIPLYTWLPDAMAGPTPVSALIHAATMVTAGVFMIARLDVLFDLAPAAGQVITLVGAITALFAATIALTQRDIKKVLAYSTISQLGFMFMAVGVGAYGAGMFHVITHAFFKALLFMGAGSVIHAMHHAYPDKGDDFAQDITNMGGLRKPLRITYMTFLAGSLALAGIAPLAGFFSKDEILHHVMVSGDQGNLLAVISFVLGLAAAACTAFYITRCFVLAFHGKFRGTRDEFRHIHESPTVMWAPLVVLALGAILAGFLNAPGEGTQYLNDFMHIKPHVAHADAHGAADEMAIGPALAAAEVGHGEDVATDAHGEAATGHADEHGADDMILGVHANEFWLMLISLLIAVGSAGVAFFLYSRKADAVAAQVSGNPLFSRAYKLLYNKYYVDEIYHRFLVRPTRNLAEALFIVVDRFLIDFTVRLIGLITQGLAQLGRRLQTGVLNLYALSFVIGVFIILGLLLIKLIFPNAG